MAISPPLLKTNIIAIVSGKGGSGKTMLAAMLAKLFDNQDKKVLLIDADFGTGGLTYYMGLNEVANISIGLTNLIYGKENKLKSLTQKIKSFKNVRFIGIGDHRRYLKYHSKEENLSKVFQSFILEVRGSFDAIIIDCRGGIDEESLAVCSSVDDILIVAETDTTSFQSTQHLVDVLYDNDLSTKLRGFFINKVFDDPSTIARSGTSAFRTQYLSAIPFDLDATRSFLIGDIPTSNTYFGRQLWHGAYKGFPELCEQPTVPSLGFAEFKGLSIRDRDSLLGGVMLSFLSMGLGTTLLAERITDPMLLEALRYHDFYYFKDEILLLSLVICSSMAGIETARKFVGSGINLYIKIVSKRLFGLK